MTERTTEGPISFEQWRTLSERVGGNLFRDPQKLEAMRSVDRLCEPDVPWERFCGLVEAKINGELIVAPSGAGKGLPEGSLPLSRSDSGGRKPQ